MSSGLPVVSSQLASKRALGRMAGVPWAQGRGDLNSNRMLTPTEARTLFDRRMTQNYLPE